MAQLSLLGIEKASLHWLVYNVPSTSTAASVLPAELLMPFSELTNIAPEAAGAASTSPLLPSSGTEDSSDP
eukprot:746131-Pleurochrysis_carterae.AAC.1